MKAIAITASVTSSILIHMVIPSLRNHRSATGNGNRCV
jgi:hypothetical protein